MYKKIAVIGASGFVGQAFVRHAQAAGHTVVAVSRSNADFTQDDSYLALKKLLAPCDVVVVLAAITPKKGSNTAELSQRFIDNLLIANNTIKALATAGVKQILYISSDAVYSPEVTEIDEISATEPDNLYGLAHKTREALFTQSFPERRLCILRPCAIYGLGDPHNAYGPNRFMQTAVTKQLIDLFGQGEELRNYVYLDDLAKIMLLAITNEVTGIFNVASQPAISFKQIAQAISELSANKIQINFTERLTPIKHRIHTSDKLTRHLTEISYTPLASALELMYKGFSKQNAEEPIDV